MIDTLAAALLVLTSILILILAGEALFTLFLFIAAISSLGTEKPKAEATEPNQTLENP